NTLSGERSRHRLTKAETRIGREPLKSLNANGHEQYAGITLRSRLVSKLHAVIRKSKDGWLLEHRGTSQSLINDSTLLPGQIVSVTHGDEIRIGEYVLHVLDDDPISREPSTVFGYTTFDLLQLERQVHADLLKAMN